MKALTTKFKIAKNPVDVNVRVFCPARFETINNEEVFVLSRYVSVPTDGWKIEQNFFPGHDFYVTSAKDGNDGFYLTEYSTGTNVSGAYPEKTKNKAAEWLRTRLEATPSFKIVQLIQTTLNDHGRYNGFEKAFSVDGLTVGLDNMTSETTDTVELFDLDTIPRGSTYYFTNGKTVKRIL